MTWDVNTPAGSEGISQGDNRIRELKSDIQSAFLGNDATLGNAGAFPGADTTNPRFHYRGLKGTTAERPTAGHYGIYFNTDTGELERDNGSAWETIVLSGSSFPATTEMLFYQSAAPLGWTVSTAIDDSLVRITDTPAEGGTTAGAWSSLNHSHTGPSHTHSMQNHTHTLPSLTGKVADSGSSPGTGDYNVYDDGGGWGTGRLETNNATPSTEGHHYHDIGGNTGVASTTNTGSGGTGSTSTATLSHSATSHAHANVIIAVKD